MGDLTENFSGHEFVCRCGCGLGRPAPALIEGLQELRELADAPIIITSGLRCPDHNNAIGGSEHSWHCYGLAADLVIDGCSVDRMAALASRIDRFRLGGIGKYPTRGIIHVDVRPWRARWTSQ